MAKSGKLTDQQRKFIDTYIADPDMNATRCYLAIYPNTKKEETAAVCASQLLRKPKVKEYLDKKRAALAKKFNISQERVLEEYAKLAFYNVQDMFDDEGRLENISTLDRDVAAAITGIDVQDVYEYNGDEKVYIGYVKKIKLSDKKGALDSVARHLGMFVDKVELSGEIKTIIESMTDDELDKAIEANESK